MARGAEPRDRERSPGRGPEDRREGSLQPRPKAREERLIRGSSGNFMGGFLLHSQTGRCIIRWGGLLNRSVSRGPRPGHSQRSWVKLKWGVGVDSDIRVSRT
jgi:hypothetical protein